MEKIKEMLNKDVKEYNLKLLIISGILFIALMGFISYKLTNSSYALFSDTVNGTKTITLHVAQDMTTLYTDGTLIINEKASDRGKNIQAHGEVINEYDAMKSAGTDVQKYVFSSQSQRPWNSVASSITSVEIGQKIEPTSTAYWFQGLTNMQSGDFTNLDTKNVTNMNSMFSEAGDNSSVTSFALVGLDNWDTSKVTNMSNMFSIAGLRATTWSIGNLSNWNTSSVTNMGYMFSNAGSTATTWSIGDLSSWDTSSVTIMTYMFSNAGSKATTFNIGNLSSWNTSSVTTMSNMFKSAGRYATTWSIGDLSSWDTSQVTDMSNMFNNAGYSTTTFNIGNLSSWDTSKVTTMKSMFDQAGYNATTFNIGNLSSWDNSKVTNMSSMFDHAGQNATTWNSIGTLKVYATNIYGMFYNCPKAKATLNIYSNPASGSSGYDQALTGAATDSSALITVNYSSATTNIDSIIATKSSNSNVVKGVQLD